MLRLQSKLLLRTWVYYVLKILKSNHHFFIFRISMRLLSSKSNTNSSSVQEQKDHSLFNGQLNGKNYLN